MSVLSLCYWESDAYWRQNNKHFAELAPQNGGKQLIWRNYVTVTLCITYLFHNSRTLSHREVHHAGSVSYLITARSELRKVLFLALWFVCLWNISGTAERICAKFIRNTCLIPLGRVWKSRSKVNVARDKNGIFRPFRCGLRAVYVW